MRGRPGGVGVESGEVGEVDRGGQVRAVRRHKKTKRGHNKHATQHPTSKQGPQGVNLHTAHSSFPLIPHWDTASSFSSAIFVCSLPSTCRAPRRSGVSRPPFPRPTDLFMARF